MSATTQSITDLLSNLHRLSVQNEELWQRVSHDTFRATLSAGTVEVCGSPTPHGLRSAIQTTWAGATGNFLWKWLSLPIKPVLLLAGSKKQSTYKWPDRRLKLTSPTGTVNEFFVDYENPIYSQVSQLLLVAELAVQTSDLADTISQMSVEIEAHLAPPDEAEQCAANGAADCAISDGETSSAAR